MNADTRIRDAAILAMATVALAPQPTVSSSRLKTLKREEINANDYRDPDHLRTHLEAFIERYGNRYRLHSATLRFLGTRRSLEPMKVGSEENNS